MYIPKLAMTYCMAIDGHVSDVSINYMSMVIASYKFTHECDNFILPFRMNDKHYGHEVTIEIKGSGSCSLDIHYDIYDNYKWANSILGKHPAFRHSSERFDTSKDIHPFKYSISMRHLVPDSYATHWGYE
jgi:hypothetical protein